MDDDPALNHTSNPVEYALFREAYQHVAIDGINYTGTRELPWIYSPLVREIEC